MNMVVLWDLGKLAERLFGNLKFLVVYMFAGIGGSSVELTGIAVTNDAGRVDSLIILAEPEQASDVLVPEPATARRPLNRMDALVLEGVAAGMSTVQLAARLFLSRGGGEYHTHQRGV